MMQDKPGWYYGKFVSLENSIERWQKDHEKLYDDAMPLQVPINEIWPYREYAWSRGNSRLTNEQWDKLAESLKTKGWDPKDPLIFVIGQAGGAKVGEGNHRLAVARALGFKTVPVWLHFNISKVTKNPLPKDWVPAR